MRVALINGSPKKKNSSSEALLDNLKSCFSSNVEFKNYYFTTPNITEKIIAELNDYDAIVFAFPLYFDAVPSHLLSCLCQMEVRGISNKQIRIFAISNCGFFEGEQNLIALDIIQNWCHKVGVEWGQGVGVGGGGALAGMKEVPLGKGPKTSLGQALEKFANNIENSVSENNVCVSINFPRFLYKLSAESGWRKKIKENGLKVKDLKRKV